MQPLNARWWWWLHDLCMSLAAPEDYYILTQVLEILKLKPLSVILTCLFGDWSVSLTGLSLNVPECKWKPEITCPCCLFMLPNACTKLLGDTLAVMLRSSISHSLACCLSLFDTSFSLTLLAIMLVSNNYLTHRQQTRIGWWQMFREGLACALTFQWGWVTLLWTLTRPPRQLQPDCSFPVSGDRWQCGLVSTPPPQSPTDVAFHQPRPADSCLQLENQASICLSFCPINRHVCLLSKQQLYTILSRWDQFLPLSIS